MAQIRSKQIADFAAITNWASATAADIAPANDIYALVSKEISTEHSHHVSGDASVALAASTALSTEISNRASADVVLSNALSTEVSNRISGDVVLSNGLSTEVSNRISGDVSLAAALNTEVTDRLDGDHTVTDFVTGVAGGTTFTTGNVYRGGIYDLEVYVNGLRVKFDQNGPNEFDIDTVYDLEATDIITVIGVQAV